MTLQKDNKAQAVVIGTSAGGIEALKKILPGLPESFPLPIVIVVHIPPGRLSLLAEIFRPKVNMKIKEADEKETLQPGTIYFAPPSYHLLIENDKTFSLTNEGSVHFSQPSIDVLFESAADAYRQNLVGILLTGANEDGAMGLKKIKAYGGVCIVQNINEAEVPLMPRSGLPFISPNCELTLSEISLFLQGDHSIGSAYV